MLTILEGTYENGIVHLDEPAPPSDHRDRKVLVVFLESAAPAGAAPTDPAGTAATTPRYSWDEALALSAGTSHVSMADEVIAERRERD